MALLLVATAAITVHARLLLVSPTAAVGAVPLAAGVTIAVSVPTDEHVLVLNGRRYGG